MKPCLLPQPWDPAGKSGRRGSNPRPTAWKAVALPTELLPHNTSMKVWEYGSMEVEFHFHILNSPISTQRTFSIGTLILLYSYTPILHSGWARMDSNHRTPERTDLQSVVVGHLTTCPNGFCQPSKHVSIFQSAFLASEPERGIEPATC